MNRKLFNLVIILLILSSGITQAQNRVRYTAIPKEGYRFVGWEDGNMDNPRTISLDTVSTSLKSISVSTPVTSRIIRLSDQIFTSTQGVVKQEILNGNTDNVLTSMSSAVSIRPLKAYFVVSGNLQTDGDDLAFQDTACNDSLVVFEFIYVPNGNVTVDNKTFTTSYNYFITETEITQLQWKYVMGCDNNPSQWQYNSFPVDSVSWYAALVFCNRLSDSLGLTKVYSMNDSTNSTLTTNENAWGHIPTENSNDNSNRNRWNAVVCDWTANGVRLPTEIEWMHAAKEGRNSSYDFSGSNTVGNVGWYYSNSGYSFLFFNWDHMTHEVKGKTANYLGLYDMTGNVHEWCWDWSGDLPSSGQTNYRGPSSGSSRVKKGACYVSKDGYYLFQGTYDDAHLYKRFNNTPETRTSNNGFRVVMSNPSY